MKKLATLIIYPILFTLLISTNIFSQKANAPSKSDKQKVPVYVDISGTNIDRIRVDDNNGFTPSITEPVSQGENVVYVEVTLAKQDNSFSVIGYEKGVPTFINKNISIKWTKVTANTPQPTQGTSLNKLSTENLSLVGLEKPKKVNDNVFKFEIIPPSSLDDSIKKYKVSVKYKNETTNNSFIDAGAAKEFPVKRESGKAIKSEAKIELKKGLNQIFVTTVGGSTVYRSNPEIATVECESPCKTPSKITLVNLEKATAKSPYVVRNKQFTFKIKPPEIDKSVEKYNITVTNKAQKYNEQYDVKIYRLKKPDETDSKAQPQEVTVALKEGINQITVDTQVKDEKDKKIIVQNLKGEAVVRCISPCESNSRSLNTRAIIGLQQVGASSAR